MTNRTAAPDLLFWSLVIFLAAMVAVVPPLGIPVALVAWLVLRKPKSVRDAARAERHRQAVLARYRAQQTEAWTGAMTNRYSRR
jgi:hypothetical protein